MKSPFKFLDSYAKEDRDIFFGRDREIEELYHRVFEGKIMLVYGVSGTGKSSLLHCGLANKFQETDWLPLVIRRGGNILNNLALAIKAASITPQTGDITMPLQFKKAIRSLYLDHYKPVFFIFDQFEELFIFGNKDEKRSFIQVIKTIVESDIQCRLIFVMREEYMASFTEFERYIPSIFQNRVRIEKMSHINALEAIKGPCKIAGITVEEGFAETLLEKLSPEDADVELTYLQVFLDRILKLSESVNPIFSIPLLSKVGNISDLLGGFLDEQINLMDDPDLAMTVLKSFVSGKGTKRPASESETHDNVKSLGREIPRETVVNLIQSFVKLRVLRDKDDHGRYELRHDSLAEKIFEKFSLAEKELLEIRQFIENAYQVYLKRKVLLNSEDLFYISNKDSLINLNDELKDYLIKSRKNQLSMKRVVRRLMSISAVATIILLATIVITISKKTKISDANKLALESISQYTSPVDRLCMAAYAWKTFNGDNSKSALMEAFNYALKYKETDENTDSIRSNYLKEFSVISTPIDFADCSMDSRYIYGYSRDSVFVWNNSGKIISRFNAAKEPIINLLMSDNSDYIGGVTRDSVLMVWDIYGTLKFRKEIIYNPLNKNQVFRFTKDNRILTLCSGNDAELLDMNGKSIQAFNHHKGDVNGLDISDDGQFVATASSDSTIDIWYNDRDIRTFKLYNSLTPHHNIVWSVDFAPSSTYVLSTSQDSTVKVTSINNNNTWGIGSDLYLGRLGKRTNWRPVTGEFDKSGTAIKIQSLDHDRNNHMNFVLAIYYETSESFASLGQIEKFDYVSFSPDNKYFACEGGNEISLLSRNQIVSSPYAFFINNRLLSFKGTRPFFSSDGEYLYTIENNQIESWFIDFDAIEKIAKNYYSKWLSLIQ
jgi:hypothetical protein